MKLSIMKPSTMAQAVTAALMTLAAVNSAVAQSSAPSTEASASASANQGLAEVVVTAERRATSAQKTPIAMFVITGDELTSKGVVSSKDLINVTPGLAITSATPNSNLSLRGVGSGGGNAYADPTVSYNLGGVNIARQFTTQSSFYDLERVELLEGPQGTLYGRNATVGALNIIPNRPGFKVENAVGIDVGNYKSFGTSGMLNMPLVDNTAAMRVAFKTTKHDGYLTNGYNDADNKALRASLLLQPNADLSMLFSVDYFHDSANGPSTVFMYPNNTTTQWQDAGNPWLGFGMPGCGNIAICPTYGNGGAGAQGPQLASVMASPVVGNDGYTNNSQIVLKSEIEMKLDGSTLTILPAYVGSNIDFKSYAQGFQQIVLDKVSQTSVEARLASNTKGPLKWVVGGFYFKESQDSTGNFLEANGFQVIRNPNLDDTSTAVFGQGTYSLSDSLRATVGLRYTNEKKSEDGFTLLDGFVCTPAAIAGGSTVVAPNPKQPVGGCSIPNIGSLSFSSTNYRTGLEFDVDKQSLLYANIANGSKAGGFWAGTAPNTYLPEMMTAYSLGSKNRFLNNTLQANVELFYWKYKDQQLSVFTGIFPAGQTARPFNVDGHIRGAKINLAYKLTPDDLFSADILLEKGEYKNFPLGSNALTQVINNSAPSMSRLNMPATSLTVGYEHTWAIADASVILAARTHYESERTISALALAGSPGQVLYLPGAKQPGYHVSNLTMTYVEPKGKWNVSAYVDNIENQAVVYTGTAGTISRGILYRPANNNATYAALNAPRTFGMRLNAKF